MKQSDGRSLGRAGSVSGRSFRGRLRKLRPLTKFPRWSVAALMLVGVLGVGIALALSGSPKETLPKEASPKKNALVVAEKDAPAYTLTLAEPKR